MEKITDIEFTIYLLKDAHGNEAFAVVEDSYNTVQVCGMRNESGELEYFESEAHNLHSFCTRNNISMKSMKMKSDFNRLWMNGVGEKANMEVGPEYFNSIK